jgi:hypothetical protein
MRLVLLLIFITTQVLFSQEKRIGKIDFLKTKRMNKNFMSNLILSKVGQELDSIQIEKDIIILNRLNGVSKAIFEVVEVESNTYQINYYITENFSLIPNLNIWTTEDNGAYRVGLYEYNFLGRNITIGGFYQYNNFNSFGINFSAPTLFSPKNGIELNTQKLSSNEPLYFDREKANYQYTNTAFEILGVHQINYKNRLKLGLSVFKEEYKYLRGTTSIAIPKLLDVNKYLFKFAYTYDDLEYNYFLVKGLKSNFFIQYVISQNDFQEKFMIGWNDLLYFKRIGNSGNFASRLRLGLASNNDSPFAPFSVDNNLNVRGVGNIIDRGTGTLVLNTEYRKTLYEKGWFVLQGNAFVDAGSWRNPGGKFSDFGNSNNFRIYPGMGIRLIHKTIFNAIFRLDYGYGVTKNASRGFVFGIEQYF